MNTTHSAPAAAIRASTVRDEPMRRKMDSQKFGSGHKVCKAEYGRFPHAYDYPGYHPSQSRRVGGRSADFTGIKSAKNSDLAAVKGWRWEVETGWEELRLVDRDGKTVARMWPVGSRWYLLGPQSIPRQCASDLEAAKRLAISMALGNLPLDKGPANGRAIMAPLKLQIGEPRSSFGRAGEAAMPGARLHQYDPAMAERPGRPKGAPAGWRAELGRAGAFSRARHCGCART
jgi:hypothetical protein